MSALKHWMSRAWNGQAQFGCKATRRPYPPTSAAGVGGPRSSCGQLLRGLFSTKPRRGILLLARHLKHSLALRRKHGGVSTVDLIGQPDLVGTWRAESTGEESLARKALVLGTHTHGSKDFHLKFVFRCSSIPSLSQGGSPTGFLNSAENEPGLGYAGPTRARMWKLRNGLRGSLLGKSVFSTPLGALNPLGAPCPASAGLFFAIERSAT
jgi:hypothetical protein